jgi:hypothetical protein
MAYAGLTVCGIVQSAAHAVDCEVVHLTLLSVHQNGAAATADVVNGVTACVQHRWSAHYRAACGSRHNFQPDYGMTVHPISLNEARPIFKQSHASQLNGSAVPPLSLQIESGRHRQGFWSRSLNRAIGGGGRRKVYAYVVRESRPPLATRGGPIFPPPPPLVGGCVCSVGTISRARSRKRWQRSAPDHIRRLRFEAYSTSRRWDWSKPQLEDPIRPKKAAGYINPIIRFLRSELDGGEGARQLRPLFSASV